MRASFVESRGQLIRTYLVRLSVEGPIVREPFATLRLGTVVRRMNNAFCSSSCSDICFQGTA